MDTNGGVPTCCVMVHDGGGSRGNEIKYDVPLYSQGDSRLCWAYCQVMEESYTSGRSLTKAEADSAAKAIAMGYHHSFNESDWNRGGWPLNVDWNSKKNNISCINDVYSMLSNSGHPLYAYYVCEYMEGHKKKTSAHLVLITGVDCENDIVYTNNPWGVYGEQSFVEFMSGFAYNGALSKSYELGFVVAVN